MKSTILGILALWATFVSLLIIKVPQATTLMVALQLLRWIGGLGCAVYFLFELYEATNDVAVRKYAFGAAIAAAIAILPQYHFHYALFNYWQ